MKRRVIRSLACLVGFAALLLPGSAAGEEADAFTGVGRADGFRVSVQMAGSAVGELNDTSGPSAQATIDSQGISVGFAALPYPGDTAATTPGLAAGAVFQALGLPPPNAPQYPLAVRSAHPSEPDAQVAQGPVTLSAHSTSRMSSAKAVGSGADSAGNVIGTTAGTAAVTVDDAGTVTVDAASTVESFTVANVLRIGRLTATANARSTPGGQPTTASTFAAEGVTIAGTPVGINDKGLVLGGSAQPLPDSSPLAQALASAGITVRYAAASKHDNAIQSAGLDVTTVAQGPTGAFTVTYSLGKARAELLGSAAPTTSELSATPDSGLDAPAPGTGVAAGAGAPGADGGAAARLSTGTQLTATQPTGTPVGTQVPISTTSLLSFYLVLVVGAVVTMSSSFILRYFGVRLAWTS